MYRREPDETNEHSPPGLNLSQPSGHCRSSSRQIVEQLSCVVMTPRTANDKWRCNSPSYLAIILCVACLSKSPSFPAIVKCPLVKGPDESRGQRAGSSRKGFSWIEVEKIGLRQEVPRYSYPAGREQSRRVIVAILQKCSKYFSGDC